MKSLKVFLLQTMLVFILQCTVVAQQTYTFTNAGAMGSSGPNSTQLNAAYLGTNLNGMVTVNNGVQTWTVPVSSLYEIEVLGAAGGTSGFVPPYGGRGAQMKGTIFMAAGVILHIVVGQKGDDGYTNGGGGVIGGGGGGGGSFVVTNSNIPLVIAGGGGGKCTPTLATYPIAVDASTTTSGCNTYTSMGHGGVNGGGGSIGAALSGAGGGGFFSNGASQNNPDGQGGNSFTYTPYGGAGGITGAGYGGNGGFGGGGGGSSTLSYVISGGGGGYSGGQGGSPLADVSNMTYNGGGGGSFNGGTNQVNMAGIGTGHGRVIIREICTIATSLNAITGAVCAGNSVSLTTNAVSNILWSNGGTNSVTVVSPTITSTYSVTGISPNGCTASASIAVTVNSVLPVLSTSASTSSVCLGGSVTLIAAGALSYSWTSGVNNGSSFSPTATSNYIVSGENGCGTATAAISITVNPIPVITVSGNTTICNGSSTSFLAGGPAITYTWNTGVTGNFISVSPVAYTSYTVTGTNIYGCKNQTSCSVLVNPNPIISMFANTNHPCEGDPVILSGSGAITYSWSSGISNNVAFYPSLTAIYTVTGTAANGCSGTASNTITVNPKPNITITNTPAQICLGEKATLNAFGATTYKWNNDSMSAQIFVTPNSTTTYWVIGTDNNGCRNTATLTQVVDLCDGFISQDKPEKKFSVYPNPTNGMFDVKLNSIEINLIRVQIVTTFGQIIVDKVESSSTFELDISNQPNGLYILKFEINKEMKILKLQKN